MRAWRPALGAFALAAVAACQAPAAGGGPGGPVAPTSPAAVASTRVSVADLTGTWVFGVRAEPGPGPVATCRPDQLMSLAQEGQRVLGSVTTQSGIVTQLEDLAGENVAGEVRLTGVYKGNLAERPVDVTYTLTFDPQTRHLRGKREAESFWAAPWVDPGVGVCGARPSTQVPPPTGR